MPDTVDGMAAHALAFIDALGLRQIDLLGFSLGGMVAQQISLKRPPRVRRLILVGTGPEGGENMGMDKDAIVQIRDDPKVVGLDKLVNLFFTSSETGQAAGRAFVERISRRAERDPVSGPEIAEAQTAAISRYGAFRGERFASLHKITQPVLVVNGNDDIMIPTVNSYLLSQHLPNATLIIYPDSGHGSLFQYAESFSWQVNDFLKGNDRTAKA